MAMALDLCIFLANALRCRDDIFMGSAMDTFLEDAWRLALVILDRPFLLKELGTPVDDAKPDRNNQTTAMGKRYIFIY